MTRCLTKATRVLRIRLQIGTWIPRGSRRIASQKQINDVAGAKISISAEVMHDFGRDLSTFTTSAVHIQCHLHGHGRHRFVQLLSLHYTTPRPSRMWVICDGSSQITLPLNTACGTVVYGNIQTGAYLSSPITLTQCK